MLDTPGRIDPVGLSLAPVRAAREFAYAGIHFEFLPQRGFVPKLPGDYTPYVVALGPGGVGAAAAPTFARVSCSVHIDPCRSIDNRQLNRVEYSGDADGFQLRHGFFHAHLRRLAPSHYVAMARVADDALATAALLRFVASAIAEYEGGLSLHAAALALDARAIVFMGPSGAGKSTACELSLAAKGARCLAYDQVVVYPMGDQFFVWALPWGAANELPRTDLPYLPLAAALRITRGRPEPSAWPVHGPEAPFLVRAAVTPGKADGPAEERRLTTVMRVVESVPVGYLSTVLGMRADRAIASFLAHQREAVA